MKIPNLTPWCNLFSTESKFDIAIGASRLQASTTLLLNLGMAAAIASLAGRDSIWLVAGLFVLSLLLFFVLYHYLWPKPEPLLLSLDVLTGIVCMARHDYLLHPGSRLAPWGCYLVLADCDGEATPTQRLFIWRDSISAQSYSRLARAIAYRRYSLGVSR